MSAGPARRVVNRTTTGLRQPSPSRRSTRRSWHLPKQSGPEPVWWIKEVVFAAVVALLAGTALYLVQDRAENHRQEKANAIEDRRQLQDQRLENLRFVRERSSPNAEETRPFGALDLRDQSL